MPRNCPVLCRVDWFGLVYITSVYFLLNSSNILLGSLNLVDLVCIFGLIKLIHRFDLIPKVHFWFSRFGVVYWDWYTGFGSYKIQNTQCKILTLHFTPSKSDLLLSVQLEFANWNWAWQKDWIPLEILEMVSPL